MIAVAQKMCGSYSEPHGERRGFFICSGCLIRECCFPLLQLSPAQQMQSKIKREKRKYAAFVSRIPHTPKCHYKAICRVFLIDFVLVHSNTFSFAVALTTAANE